MLHIVDRWHEVFKKTIKRTPFKEVAEEDVVMMQDLLKKLDVDFMAATEVGLAKRFIVCRIPGLPEVMVNPRVTWKENRDSLLMVETKLHTKGSYICKYASAVTAEWTLLTGVTQRQMLLGIQGCMFQSALGYLDGKPPWLFEPLE
jgi:peptide deformylase